VNALASRLAGGALALAMLVATSGCGDPIKAYCGKLGGDQKTFAAMFQSNSPTSLITHLPMLKDLAGSAPEDLTDEWQTFINAVEGLSDALHQAGIGPDAYQNGKPPAGLSTSEQQAIADAATRLGSTQVQDSVKGIDQEARDVCKIDLGT
jgi:hypothetical protein